MIKKENKIDFIGGLDFVSIVSHELNSSLNIILNTSELLLNFYNKQISKDAIK